MIRYITKQNKNKKSSAFGKWYAYPVVEETMDLAALAKHMEEHNSGFSEAICTGVMKAMVKCIKEQLLEGKNVKIDNLAIFSVGIKNSKGGATSEEEFNLAKNISSVKLRARATGVLIAKSLNLEATLKRASAITGSGATSPSPTTGGESGNNGGNTGGNSGSNNSGNTPGGNTPGGNGDDPEN